MPEDGDFSSSGVLPVMREACRRAGLNSDGAELLRLGENAVFGLVRIPVAVRIARLAGLMPRGVRSRGPDQCLDHLRAVTGENTVKCGSELAVPVANEDLNFPARSPRSIIRLQARTRRSRLARWPGRLRIGLPQRSPGVPVRGPRSARVGVSRQGRLRRRPLVVLRLWHVLNACRKVANGP